MDADWLVGPNYDVVGDEITGWCITIHYTWGTGTNSLRISPNSSEFPTSDKGNPDHKLIILAGYRLRHGTR